MLISAGGHDLDLLPEGLGFHVAHSPGALGLDQWSGSGLEERLLLEDALKILCL